MIRERNAEKKNKSLARDICYIAMFVAVMTVCSWMSVLIGSVPVTFQTLGVCLTAGILGWKRGTIAIGSYIALGLCGAPVFAGFTGGFAKLAMPTGGYILGFLPTALIVGCVSDLVGKKFGKRKYAALSIACLLGMFACYAVGVLWFMIYNMGTQGAANFLAAVLVCVVPYLPFDFAKIAVAVFLVFKLKKHIK